MMEKPGRARSKTSFFPESGIASVVAVQANETRIEVGLIGCEGMSGIAIVLGNHQSPNETYMQVAGAGQRISVGALRAATAKSAGMHGIMLKYVQAFMTQTAHTAICNARSHIDQRLSRWILMAHDRTSDTIPLTHEFLSLMLGVRRAGVTEALQCAGHARSHQIRARADHGARSQGTAGERGRFAMACPRPNTAACSANDLYGIGQKEFSHFRPASLTNFRLPKKV